MIKTDRYIIKNCNEFIIKDDGIYHKTKTIEDSGIELTLCESLVIPKDIFIEAFNKWCK